MSPEQSIGALTPKLLSSLREGYEMKSEDLVRHNAVTNNEINKLALNRQIGSGFYPMKRPAGCDPWRLFGE